MRNIRIIATAVILILLAASTSQAFVLRQDNHSCKSGSSEAIVLSPDQKWCNDILPTNRVLLRTNKPVSGQLELKWNVRPIYGTTSRNHMTPYKIVDDTSVNKPVREWTHSINRGVIISPKLGDCWKISNMTPEGQYKPGLGMITSAAAVVPEPGAFVSLFAGIAGLGLTRLRKKK